jgi:hypothetical protein
MEHNHSLYLSTETGAERYLCLYERIISYLIEDYAVIYAVESNTNIVIRRLSMLDNRIPNFIQNHTLVVADPASIYRSGPKTSFISAIQKIHGKTSTAKQIVVIGSLAHTLSGTKLVEYEKSVGKAFNEPIEAICCYHASHQKRLSLPDIISRCLLPITIQFTASNGITAHGLKREDNQHRKGRDRRFSLGSRLQ